MIKGGGNQENWRERQIKIISLVKIIVSLIIMSSRDCVNFEKTFVLPTIFQVFPGWATFDAVQTSQSLSVEGVSFFKNFGVWSRPGKTNSFSKTRVPKIP